MSTWHLLAFAPLLSFLSPKKKLPPPNDDNGNGDDDVDSDYDYGDKKNLKGETQFF